MISKNSLVSIIIATYNRANLIGEALESISGQTYSNWECIIIDDGGSDNTEELLQTILKADKRFRFYKRSANYKKGLPGSRNMGLDHAKGDAVIFFDDDDIVHPENLQINLNVLASHQAKFCRYDKKPFRENWEDSLFEEAELTQELKVIKVGKKDIGKVLSGVLPFASCTVMWDKSCFEHERFNEDLQYAEEWELYSRLISSGYTGVSINKVLYFNRKHPDSNTGEFYNSDPVRRRSKVKAVHFVIENLSEKNLLDDYLFQYFIRLGFFLNDFSIINITLKKSRAGFFTTLKYKMGYVLYPVLRPLFLLKAATSKNNKN